jgi:very-short-patch-repair endonuclease
MERQFEDAPDADLPDLTADGFDDPAVLADLEGEFEEKLETDAAEIDVVDIDVVDIDAGVLPRAHPALIDNGFSLVHTLRLENRGEITLRDLRLTIATDPPFARPVSVALSVLDSGQAQHLSSPEVELDGSFFRDLTETMSGTVIFELEADGRTVGRTRVAVELCPPSVWPGLAIYPEFLAAFVLPNEPAVQPVLVRARRFLADWTGDPSLNGYQSGDDTRVLAMGAAIYAGLQEVGLTYINPPASFAEQGQRVRLPHELLEHEMGTCLDLTLLFAACLEQAGLFPLLILVEGHALAGLWLREEYFGDPVIEEPHLLLNRAELGEIALIDITTVAGRPSVEFDQSQAGALRQLRDSEKFQCAIDVRRARHGKVRPLATLGVRPDGEGFEATSIPATPTSAPELAGLQETERLRRAAQEQTADRRPQDRIDLWCRKLLDLTMRNRLLNFRTTKKTVPLLCPDAALLEDALSEGRRFRVLSRPAELDDDGEVRRPGMTRADLIEAIHDLLREQLDALQLRADLDQENLEARLVGLYRDARTATEEGGSSNLYLAIGFLEYRETPGSSQTRRAPILLLPVELRRSSVRGKITLALGGDEPRVNVTLLEYLRRDHGIDVPGLDPLPHDDSGLDVPLILHQMREAIRGKAGWSVDPETALGIFSFAKILIWKDLMERRDLLLENPLVGHLVRDFFEPWDDGVEFPELAQLDDDYPATEVLCPLSADSSQLSAILAAAKGKSFVLQGPPGTGKSQTITNLIAHCLAEGKRVLFVSQKMAALEVVHERLQQVGLSEACLELHSSKAKKKEVLEQLRQALEAVAEPGAKAWQSEAQALETRRKELNAYVRAMHRRYPSGETPFDALSRLTAIAEGPALALGWDEVAATTEEQLAAARRAVRDLEETGAAVGLQPEHPFLSIGKCDYTLQWERDAEEALPPLDQAFDALHSATNSLFDRLGIEDREVSWDGFAAWAELAVHLGKPPTGLSREMISDPSPGDLPSRVEAWLRVGREIAEQTRRLEERYRESPLELPLEELRQLSREAHTTWWFSRWLKLRRIRKAFRSLARQPREISVDAAIKDLRHARELRGLKEELSGLSSLAGSVLGDAWRGEASDWDAIEQAVAWTAGLGDRLDTLEGAVAARREELLAACRRLLFEGGGDESEIDTRRVEFLACFEAASTGKRGVEELLALDEPLEKRREETPADGDVIDRMRARIATWRERWREIPEWCSWRRARREAVERDLEGLVTGLESARFRLEESGEVFERAYADAWYTAVSSAEPVLARFLGTEHSRNIAAFRRLDSKVLELTRAELRRHVVSGWKSASEAPASSELGKLQRELTKRRRHIALRKLFKEIPTLLTQLKPCFLMSPMSVAQYLEAAHRSFDLLVFDEASQIPVWDAVGAIARARQVVVVGDSKQLPPTSFFERTSDEGPEDMVEDQESILDECLAVQFPSRTLNWHYRSRHESLIAFSNERYYDNRLTTFPACEDRNLGVSFRYVPDGVYDRGKSRTNEVEARALVAEVVDRLRDPARASFSIGVVTFNQTQQMLVQDLLDAERRNHPEIEGAFAEDNPDAVFVKNLENVQGDERDVILFSVGYGPDRAGRVHTNFGPLNRDGGERRLNVAITRARREAVVFSSMRADQVPVERTRKQGVRDLKLYLDYAEHGSEVFARELAADAGGEVGSPLEGEVKAALQSRGWEVHSQVGCSGYRVDLAVVDPDSAGRYRLGVECDGAMYHRAKTARDRDKLRQEVLEALGWSLHRVWSTDWWRDPEGQLRRIEEALEQAAARRREEELARMSAATPADDEPSAIDESEPPEEPEEQESPGEPEFTPDADLEKIGVPYEVAKLGRRRGSPESFYEARTLGKVGDLLRKVVEVEAPIALARAAKLVAGQWDLTRLHDKAQRRIQEAVLQQRLLVEDDLGELFLWPEGTDPEHFLDFRPPGKAERSRRPADEISTREFAHAAHHLLERFGGMEEQDLVREVGRIFGYGRVGTRVRARIDGGIERLFTAKRIGRLDGNVRLAEPGEMETPAQ